VRFRLINPIVHCNINGCTSLWLRVPFGYIRLSRRSAKGDNRCWKRRWVSVCTWDTCWSLRNPLPPREVMRFRYINLVLLAIVFVAILALIPATLIIARHLHCFHPTTTTTVVDEVK
jgi:hypothetical protein